MPSDPAPLCPVPPLLQPPTQPWNRTEAHHTQWRMPSSHSNPSSLLSLLPPAQNFCHYRFLKGALHERSGILAVDSVSGDGHQVATTGHGITQESQVPVIDVGTIEGDDVVQLPLQGLPHGFYAQHLAWGLQGCGWGVKGGEGSRPSNCSPPAATTTQIHRGTVRSQ